MDNNNLQRAVWSEEQLHKLSFLKWLEIEEGTTTGDISNFALPIGAAASNAFIHGDAQDAFEKCGPTMCGGMNVSKKHRKKHRHHHR